MPLTEYLLLEPLSSLVFSKTAGPIKAKFHIEPQWDEETKVCLWGLGHKTRMTTTPIYGKNPSKILEPKGQ